MMNAKPKVTVLPHDAKERKKFPLYSGCMNYFPNALLLVARQSYEGNEQHNPGTPLHWDRSKSGDELDALARHVEEGEWVAVAWRALAHLEKMVEQGYNPFAKDEVRVSDAVYDKDQRREQEARLLDYMAQKTAKIHGWDNPTHKGVGEGDEGLAAAPPLAAVAWRDARAL